MGVIPWSFPGCFPVPNFLLLDQAPVRQVGYTTAGDSMAAGGYHAMSPPVVAAMGGPSFL